MRLMRLEEVCETAGIGKTLLYKLIGEGAFPKPVNIGDRAVRWVQGEVDDWILARIEERDVEPEQPAGTPSSTSTESSE
jgi:prophage regulatory protein